MTLVGGAVEVEHRVVHRYLLLGRHTLEPRTDHLVHVLHRLEHALAAEPLLIAVAQLDRFVLAGGGAARHGRPSGRAAREGDVRLDDRVAPAVENLARAYRDDRAHDGPYPSGRRPLRQRAPSGRGSPHAPGRAAPGAARPSSPWWRSDRRSRS